MITQWLEAIEEGADGLGFLVPCLEISFLHGK